jgi:hypothetical protein
MLKLKVFCIVFSGLVSFSIVSARAQESTTTAKTVVLFDPLFWKEDLKLSTNQCQKIKDINFEFFQQINSLTHENRGAVPAKTAELLSDRSEKIWSTFQPRQKKKWKKIWSTES